MIESYGHNFLFKSIFYGKEIFIENSIALEYGARERVRKSTALCIESPFYCMNLTYRQTFLLIFESRHTLNNNPIFILVWLWFELSSVEYVCQCI